MAIKVNWNDETKTVLIYQFDRVWDKNELEEAVINGFDLIESVAYPVAIVFDLSACDKTNGGELLFWRKIMRVAPTNMQALIFVTSSPIILTTIRMFLNINKIHQHKIHVCDTITDASAVLRGLNIVSHKILIVEDDDWIREEIVDLLALNGYQTLDASNGLSALHLAKEHLPSLIISDIAMPQMDGFELLDELRKSPATAPIPVIMLTAHSDRSFIRHGMEMGADDYVTKPFTNQELLNAVKVRLTRSQVLKAAAS